MVNFLVALQFLTAIPMRLKQISDKNIARSMVYFPIIGLILGIILVGINSFLSFLNFADISVNIVLVVSLAAITAGLHLDGLSDTLDAVLSGKDKEETLKIMRDPHIGAMGTLGIISALLLNIALLSSIGITLKNTALLMACLLSRWSMVLAISLFPYARQDGKAKLFIQNINLKIFIMASLITLAYTLIIWQIKGLLVLSLVAISTCCTGAALKRRISGITGDTLGAINESTEIIILFTVCLLERIAL